MSAPDSSKLRVATYNVHACYGMDRQRSETRIAEVIAELGVDLVGLQELDLSRPRSGGVDQAGLIAEKLGWHRYFHPAMQSGDEHYGNAILSRYPLTLRHACALPGTGTFYCRESRVAISMDVETPLGVVHVINTHFGLGRSERLLQAQLLNEEWLAAGPTETPTILLGDFNSLPWLAHPPCAWASISGMCANWSRRSGHFALFRPPSPPSPSTTFSSMPPCSALGLDVHRSPLARVASDHYPLVAEFARV